MEPENQAGLVEFIERVRAAYPAGSGKTIWCFTGDVLEELMPGGRHHTEVTDRILTCSICWWMARLFRICTISHCVLGARVTSV